VIAARKIFPGQPCVYLGIGCYFAVLSSALAPTLQDSCGENRSLADNFLQKQQKQQKTAVPGSLGDADMAALRGATRSRVRGHGHLAALSRGGPPSSAS
jgi:hypothetical protein